MMAIRSRVRTVMVGLALCLAQGAAADDKTAQEWMSRVLEADKQVSFEGTFIYRRGAQVETLQLVHQAGEDAIREKLTALSGMPREIIRRDDALLYIVPENGAELLRQVYDKGLHRTITAPSLDLAHLQRHYTFALTGQSRAAGRPTVMLSVHPKDEYRYGYRLWVDRESGLVLRSDLLGSDGVALEQVIFTHVELLSEVPPALLEPTLDGRQVQRRVEEMNAAEASDSRWQVGWLPPGFVQRLHNRRADAGDGHLVEYFVFEDGLAKVSIFIEAQSGERTPIRGTAKLGALNACGRDANSHGVVVVGDVPMTVVRRIAQSVTPRQDGQQTHD